MANIEDLVKRIRNAVSRSEIKEALQSCLEYTTSLHDHSCPRPGMWFPIGESLLHAMVPSFIGVLSKREFDDLLVETFIRAPMIDSIPLLTHSLKSANAYALEKTLHLLDTVVKRNLTTLFIDLSSPSVVDHFMNEETESIDRLIQDLVSIPERAATVVRGRVDANSAFHANIYSRTVFLAIIGALRHCHDLLASGTGDCSLKFLSSVLSKFYMHGYGSSIMRILAPCLYGYCGRRGIKDGVNLDTTQHSDDYIWRRLSKRLLTGVHTMALDNVMADLVIILSTRDHGKLVDLEKLLGDAVDEDEKIRYIIVNKLLLTRYFDESTTVPETIFHYLSNTPERRSSIMRPTLLKLLTVWSSSASITRTNFEKHYYISRCICVCMAYSTNDDRKDMEKDATPYILRGITAHLNVVDVNVRKLGMVVGELLTSSFTVQEDGGKLKFEYEDDDRTRYLKGLFSRRSEENDLVSFDDLVREVDEIPVSSTTNAGIFKVSTGLDSDDEDLVPYDIPKEVESGSCGSSKEQLPIYIRDCLDCIVARKSFHLYETGLRTLENLIRRNSPGADDLAVDITRILLHAEDHYGLGAEFQKLQNSIMTACCVRQPKRVASWLTAEFYEKNYTIQHRLLILDVLVNAAKELANPMAETTNDDKDIEVVVIKKPEPGTPTPATPTWRQVIQARLEKKTRKWGSAVTGQSSKITTPAAPNRLNPVAGPCFFYPLLANLDKRMDTMDMFNADYVILGRLLFVTGTILYEAENALGICSMAVSQIHVVLRRTGRHKQSFVRQGSIFALIMALMVVPSRILAMEYQDELSECRFLLERVRSDDPDEQCRQLADHALTLVNRKANEGLNSVIEIGIWMAGIVSNCIMRTPPLWSTIRVNTLKLDMEEAKRRMEAILDEQYTKRHRIRPRHAIRFHPQLPDLLLIQGSGPRAVQPLEKEIYVDMDCGCAVMRGADIYAPGLLASNGNFAKGDVVSVYMDLDGACKRGLKRPYDGQRTLVGNGIVQYSRNDIFAPSNADGKSITGVGVSMIEPIWDHPKLDGAIVEDWGFVQNLPSIVCGHVLDPQPGEIVLDMCAAPGGKSMHIATLMKDQGRIVCIDSSSNRVKELLNNVKAMSLNSIEVYKMNGVDLMNSGNAAKSLPTFQCETFDRILLDAPCSCTGQRPMIKRISHKQRLSHVPQVRKLLNMASNLLKKSGTMVFSTCSLETEENENQVEWFLKEHPDMELSAQNPFLGQEIRINGKSSVQKFDPRRFCKDISDISDHSCDRISRDHAQADFTCDHDSIGFFIAKFMKM